jgi:hypothetical protein
MMENELEFAGAGLATTFMLRALLDVLTEKKILSKGECTELLDRAQICLEQQQRCDLPENADVWRIAREFLDHLISTVPVVGAVADCQ